MRKLIIVCSWLTGMFFTASAQQNPFTGTWKMSRKPWPHIPATIMELEIGEPADQVLFPAKLNIKFGNFSASYKVLLVKKNDRQLGIGRNKVPISETPFRLGIWLMYLNGTLDLEGKNLELKRMWIDNFGIWMKGLYDDDEIYVNTKVTLRDLLYRDSISFRKTSAAPWKDSATQEILHPENRDLFYGIYDRIVTHDPSMIVQVNDEETLDKDTVTLVHNGKPLLDKAEVNEDNRRQNIRLDSGMNILAFFADNYGRLPPNTGRLYMGISQQEYALDFTYRANAFATFMVAQVLYEPGKKDTSTGSRKTEPLGSFEVKDKNLVLELWDGQVEDGDSVTLRLNGHIVQSGFPVRKKLAQVPVELRRGENVLLFTADNLGSIPPNTAELRIRYGGQTKSFGLNTDMKRNNEIRIRYVPE
ncbi:hypothetical protein ACFOTA_11680 [Chitinophaga sp. GCM10012297]|uniref:Uncharacterized protein n=1 Tax=Chitinophaga chungangae TaxID=2821488 RepID=A0ABS3YDV4_9BACT|nr:hypothetical protein [Chitinophaga chungangae]MBO9152871.1 hypothetical protein [Chitinophaga chungangae]